MQKDMQRGFSTFSKVTAQVNVVKDSNMENTKKYYLIHCQTKNLLGMSNALSDRFSNLKKSLPNLLQKYSLCSISEFQGKSKFKSTSPSPQKYKSTIDLFGGIFCKTDPSFLSFRKTSYISQEYLFKQKFSSSYLIWPFRDFNLQQKQF